MHQILEIRRRLAGCRMKMAILPFPRKDKTVLVITLFTRIIDALFVFL